MTSCTSNAHRSSKRFLHDLHQRGVDLAAREIDNPPSVRACASNDQCAIVWRELHSMRPVVSGTQLNCERRDRCFGDVDNEPARARSMLIAVERDHRPPAAVRNRDFVWTCAG